MTKILWGIVGAAAGFAVLYVRLRADYRMDLINPASRVKIQTLFGRYEEDRDYRK